MFKWPIDTNHTRFVKYRREELPSESVGEEVGYRADLHLTKIP